jgi:hypothetical protein
MRVSRCAPQALARESGKAKCAAGTSYSRESSRAGKVKQAGQTLVKSQTNCTAGGVREGTEKGSFFLTVKKESEIPC